MKGKNILRKMENMVYQNLCDAAKPVLRRTSVAITIYIKKEEDHK